MKRHTLNSSKFGILGVTAILATVGLVGLSFPAMAITEQSDVNVSFTFSSVLGVSVSSNDLSIDDLAPGTAADSNVITVNVLSNSPYGYTLNSTVGNSTYNNRNLTHATVNNATPFSSIDFGTTKANKESFSNSQWGYSFSLDNGTTWINATKTNGTTNDTGYSGLPLYSDSSHIATIKESNSTSALNGDNVKFKIAAKADTTQIAGEYNNVINFQVTGNAAPEPTYMQNWSGCSSMSTGDTITLVDNRDSEEYIVGKLADENCWMLDNLRLDPTTIPLATLQGNTNASNTTLNYLKNGGGSSPYTSAAVANKTSNFTEFNTPNINTEYKTESTTSYGVGGGKTGVYYNYCAATAGSYCYDQDSGTGDASEDICPTGWRLPTGGSSGEFQSLSINYASTIASQSNSFQYNFSVTIPGMFSWSSRSYTDFGYWWSSTHESNNNIYDLSLNNSQVYTTYGDSRSYGLNVRCILN